jgi:hypothetical protein
MLVRVAPATRKAIEMEATQAGQSISHVAEQCLRLGLREMHLRKGGDSMGALCYLISGAADVAGIKAQKGKSGFDWRSNPFVFQSFKLAVLKILDALAPAGEVRPLDEQMPALKGSTIFGRLDTPEARANDVAMIILHNLQHAEAGAGQDSTAFNMARARQSLQLHSPDIKGGKS